MKHPLTKAFLCATLAPLFLTAHAMGAVITWDTHAAYQVNASDPTQISTAGTLLTAVAFSSTTTAGYTQAGAPQTVNGVTFDCLPLVPNTPGVPHAVSANASLSFQAGGFTGTGVPATSYTNLFDTGIYQPDGSTASSPLILNGLTIGNTYQFQVWNSYWPGVNTVRFSDTIPTLSGGAYNSTNQSATLLTGTTNTSTTPQYTFGTFTADSSTENIYWYGDVSNYGIFGAFQVRDITGVPEPTTVALFSLGVLGLVVRGRSRQRKLIA